MTVEVLLPDATVPGMPDFQIASAAAHVAASELMPVRLASTTLVTSVTAPMVSVEAV
jgi:hypothetical protein